MNRLVRFDNDNDRIPASVHVDNPHRVLPLDRSDVASIEARTARHILVSEAWGIQSIGSPVRMEKISSESTQVRSVPK